MKNEGSHWLILGFGLPRQPKNQYLPRLDSATSLLLPADGWFEVSEDMLSRHVRNR